MNFYVQEPYFIFCIIDLKAFCECGKTYSKLKVQFANAKAWNQQCLFEMQMKTYHPEMYVIFDICL